MLMNYRICALWTHPTGARRAVAPVMSWPRCPPNGVQKVFRRAVKSKGEANEHLLQRRIPGWDNAKSFETFQPISNCLSKSPDPKISIQIVHNFTEFNILWPISIHLSNGFLMFPWQKDVRNCNISAIGSQGPPSPLNSPWPAAACSDPAVLETRLGLEGIELQALGYPIYSYLMPEKFPSLLEKTSVYIYSGLFNVQPDPTLMISHDYLLRIKRRWISTALVCHNWGIGL